MLQKGWHGIEKVSGCLQHLLFQVKVHYRKQLYGFLVSWSIAYLRLL